MRKKTDILLFVLLVFTSYSLNAKNRIYFDSDSTKLLTDSVGLQRTDSAIYVYNFLDSDGKWLGDSIVKNRLDSLVKQQSLTYSDSLLFQANNLFAPLVYYPKQNQKLKFYSDENFCSNHQKIDTVPFVKPKPCGSTENIVASLRSGFRDLITNHHADMYAISFDQLPQSDVYKQHFISSRPVGLVHVDKGQPYNAEKGQIKVSEIEKMYWRKKATALFQFSQNYISSNWYQGGNSNLALLSVLTGQLVYDNLDNIQWENNVEWRAGFNSVEGDTLRALATNDDLLRYTTKFGIKAFGNWFYSASGEASTQLFDNFKAINSSVLKARFLTPVRVNLGIGMDYKYKKILSLMIAPITYKYIYVNDTANVNPNLFGIVRGQNHLSEIGSSFNAQVTYSPLDNWQITSRLTFFTNYKKVETDCEIVNNFTFNRFISARLMLNPRYDNTVIQKNGEKAGIQFKQLLSVGLSLRLI